MYETKQNIIKREKENISVIKLKRDKVIDFLS